MKDNLDISDARPIIRNLMTFIVVEGKEYVDNQKKKEYVSGYIKALIKTINLIDEGKDFTLVEDITDDITTYLK